MPLLPIGAREGYGDVHRVAPRAFPHVLTTTEMVIDSRSPRGGGGSGGGSGGGGGGGGRGGSSGGSGRTGGGSSSSGSSAKSGSSSGKKPNVGTGAVNYGNNGLPLWAIILIVVIILDILLFTCALVFYYRKEKQTGQKVRHKHVWWQAFKISSFLFIPIWIYKKTCGKHHTKKSNSGSSSSSSNPAIGGTYSKIDEGQHDVNANAGDENRPLYDPYAGYGDPAGYYGGAPPRKYEPYATAIPNASPYGSPAIGGVESGKPTTMSAMPPPYVSQQQPEGGAAQEYYSQQPLGPPGVTSPQPSPGPAAVTFPASAYAAPAQQPPVHNPYSMSATYTPGQ